MKYIEEFLDQLKNSDLSDLALDSAVRAQLYREHLSRLRDAFAEDRAPLLMPDSVGCFDCSEPGHFHPTPEIFMQISGSTHFTCPSGEFELMPGEICVMPTGVPHLETLRDGERPFLTIVLMVWREGVSLHFTFNRYERLPYSGLVDRFQVDSRNNFLQLIKIISEHGIESSGPDSYIRHLFSAILDRIFEATDHPVEKTEFSTPLVNKCRNLIVVHQDEVGFNVQALSRIMSYHPDYLSRSFQQETGQTLTQYLNQQRINRAKHHLTGTMTVNEVAWSCGFSHTSYFIRVFKQLTGTTPKAYREANLK